MRAIPVYFRLKIRELRDGAPKNSPRSSNVLLSMQASSAPVTRSTAPHVGGNGSPVLQDIHYPQTELNHYWGALIYASILLLKHSFVYKIPLIYF
jgi:hypothetical protein